uniref:DUF6146 family protein n=1 Tax=Roseihalotalea indica TaxID=2867963 RepID=A0AA49GKP2_9BACT|nr:DUF6146 family protein [Tunicatimonas sp. TK19036]
MKSLGYIMLFFLISAACAPSYTSSSRDRTQPNIVQPEDEEEYEVLIIDPDFDRWFQTNGRPVGFYSEQYYAQKNRQYVASWNEKVGRYGGNSPFQNIINYDYSEDYGIELNYQLFWYFKYIENAFGRRYNFPT